MSMPPTGRSYDPSALRASGYPNPERSRRAVDAPRCPIKSHAAIIATSRRHPAPLSGSSARFAE